MPAPLLKRRSNISAPGRSTIVRSTRPRSTLPRHTTDRSRTNVASQVPFGSGFSRDFTLTVAPSDRTDNDTFIDPHATIRSILNDPEPPRGEVPTGVLGGRVAEVGGTVVGTVAGTDAGVLAGVLTPPASGTESSGPLPDLPEPDEPEPDETDEPEPEDDPFPELLSLACAGDRASVPATMPATTISTKRRRERACFIVRLRGRTRANGLLGCGCRLRVPGIST